MATSETTEDTAANARRLRSPPPPIQNDITEDTATYSPYNPNDYPRQQQQHQFPMFSQAPPGAAYGPPPPPPPPEWDFNQPIQNDANQFNF